MTGVLDKNTQLESSGSEGLSFVGMALYGIASAFVFALITAFIVGGFNESNHKVISLVFLIAMPIMSIVAGLVDMFIGRYIKK